MVFRLFSVQVVTYTASASSYDHKTQFRILLNLKILTATIVCSALDTCIQVVLSTSTCRIFT